jgi:hypothetical protein
MIITAKKVYFDFLIVAVIICYCLVSFHTVVRGIPDNNPLALYFRGLSVQLPEHPLDYTVRSQKYINLSWPIKLGPGRNIGLGLEAGVLYGQKGVKIVVRDYPMMGSHSLISSNINNLSSHQVGSVALPCPMGLRPGACGCGSVILIQGRDLTL